MTLEQVGIVLAIVTSLGSILGGVYVAAVKIARLELKVDTIWEFLINRALSEAVTKGFATMNSPAIVTPEAKKLLAGFADALKGFYRTRWHKLPEPAILLEIEKEFGSRLVQEVCIPNKMSNGACLLIAADVAKEGFTNGELR